MDSQDFIAYADKMKRSARDLAFLEFLDHAIRLVQLAKPQTVSKFDRKAYQREYMRKRRAAKK